MKVNTVLLKGGVQFVPHPNKEHVTARHDCTRQGIFAQRGRIDHDRGNLGAAAERHWPTQQDQECPVRRNTAAVMHKVPDVADIRYCVTGAGGVSCGYGGAGDVWAPRDATVLGRRSRNRRCAFP